MPKRAVVADATITAKNQLTIPKSVRQEMGIASGARVRFTGTRHNMRVSPVEKQIDYRDFVGIGAGKLNIPKGMSAVEYVRWLRGGDDLD